MCYKIGSKWLSAHNYLIVDVQKSKTPIEQIIPLCRFFSHQVRGFGHLEDTQSDSFLPV